MKSLSEFDSCMENWQTAIRESVSRVNGSLAEMVPEPVRIPPNKMAQLVRFGRWTGTDSQWYCVRQRMLSLLKWQIKWTPGNDNSRANASKVKDWAELFAALRSAPT